MICDICNNTECFTEDDITRFIDKPDNSKTIYYVVSNSEDNPDFILENSIYEYHWLNYIFDNPTFIPIKLTMEDENGRVEETIDNIMDIGAGQVKPLWFLVTRPHVNYFNKLFTELNTLGIQFNVLHLADEFSADNISFYSLPYCKNIIRNYWRNDCVSMKHVMTIPLGYHHEGCDSIKTFAERELVWCFHGTNWFDRKAICDKLTQFVPYNCHFTPEWNHSSMTGEVKYTGTLLNSKFCPIIRGNNLETFRLYECLENGAIPIYVRYMGDDLFWNWLSAKLCLLNIPDWDKALMYMDFLLKNPEKAEQYRLGIMTKWQGVKDEYIQLISKL